MALSPLPPRSRVLTLFFFPASSRRGGQFSLPFLRVASATPRLRVELLRRFVRRRERERAGLSEGNGLSLSFCGLPVQGRYGKLGEVVPIHHFMAEDLAGSLLAIGVLPLVVWVPGYALAWLLDLFEFRRRTAAFRAAFSVPLSIAVCPIVTYLLGRFGSMSAVWTFYIAAAALVSILGWRAARRGRFVRPKGWGVFAAAALVWLGVALFSLIDWQIGNRLYYPANALDYSLRAALTHSIGATGIPPQSPLFLPPGHPVALRYHYFWLLLLSLVNRMAPHWIGARQAEIAGTFWCGIGLMAAVASCLRLFLTGRPQAFRRRALVGILLLGITGLDIVPGLFLLFLYARGMMDFVLPSLESWNEYVDWFLHSSIWAPHAVAALIACITGFLLVWQAPAAANRRALLRYGPIGGMAFASAAGTSIWVAFVFGVFLIVWTAICAWKRWRREVLALAIAGGAALLLVLPYLQDLRAASVAAGPGTPGGRILTLTVRTFSLAALIPHWPGMPEWGRLLLVNGSLLPLNYFLEFGFFFLIGRIKWRQYRASGRPLSRQDLACAAMLAVSTLICTFLKSSVIGNNDLGWRGFLPAQFVLLLWSVDIWMERAKLTAISALQRTVARRFHRPGRGRNGIRPGHRPRLSPVGRPRRAAAHRVDGSRPPVRLAQLCRPRRLRVGPRRHRRERGDSIQSRRSASGHTGHAVRRPPHGSRRYRVQHVLWRQPRALRAGRRPPDATLPRLRPACIRHCGGNMPRPAHRPPRRQRHRCRLVRS